MTQARTSKDVLQELNNESKEIEEYFTPEAMIIAIADKKRRRARKGLDFNCVVLDRASTNGDELESFVRFLEREKSGIPDNTRFQVVYRTRTRRDTYHWSAMDVLVRNGELQFYLLDAANSLSETLPALSIVHTHCPHAIIRYSGGQLQVDGHNCATFSLDHVFRMAKIPDLHDQLNRIEHHGSIGRYSSYNKYMSEMLRDHPEIAGNRANQEVVDDALRHLRYVSLNAFPPSFGPLLRNMQNVDVLQKDFSPAKMQGNDSEGLKKYVDDRTVRHSRNPHSEPKPRNNAVVLKRKKIKLKAALYMKELDEREFKSAIEKNSDYKSAWQKVASASSMAAVAKVINPAPRGSLGNEIKVADVKKGSNNVNIALPQNVQRIINKLSGYIGLRNQEMQESKSYFHSFWGKLTGMSGTTKVNAATKLLKLLQGQPLGQEFLDIELDALRNDRLGDIVYDCEREGLLPREFLAAENLKIIRRRFW